MFSTILSLAQHGFEEMRFFFLAPLLWLVVDAVFQGMGINV